MASNSGATDSVLRSLMEHYGHGRGYDRQISDKHLVKISQSCCRRWKSLRPFLELEEIVEYNIDHSADDEEEKRLKFLKKWKEIKASDATYKKLISALLEIEYRDERKPILCAS